MLRVAEPETIGGTGPRKLLPVRVSNLVDHARYGGSGDGQRGKQSGNGNNGLHWCVSFVSRFGGHRREGGVSV
jgi:hypothetical protein